MRDSKRRIERVLLWLALTAFLTMCSAWIPDDPPLAYDWRTYFMEGRNIPSWYPPWTIWLTRVLTLPVLHGVTLSTFAMVAWYKKDSAISLATSFLALPLIWTLFLGQLDGLSLLGVVGLPWLMPLVLLKPHVASFAIFARRDCLLVALAFCTLTIAVWGLWPLDVLMCHVGDPPDRWPQNIALGLWGLPIFAAMVWKMPKDDPDWWMLAGAAISPQLIQYNLLPLMPAIARLEWPWAVAATLTSWLPLAANWLGPWAWHLGWVSVLMIGLGLATKHRSQA